MEGRSAAGELAVSSGVREAANAAAQQAPKRRREEGGEPKEAARKKQREAAAALSGKKRKRDPEDGSGSEGGGGDGPQLVEVERLPTTPVPQPASLPTLPPLQPLLDACHAVFNGSNAPPTAAVVPFIRGIMDKIGPGDVGLRDEVRFFHRMNAAGRQNPPIITCKAIRECSNFTIRVFFLPQGAIMPLHDHPGMTVFSKLLVGAARVEAYDWVRPRVFAGGWGGSAGMMLAEKVLDHHVTAPSGAWVLFPDTGGNIHRFIAGEDGPCAFLDVLTPPYSRTEQRRCAFYQDFPYERHPGVVGGGLTEEKKRRLAWLQEVGEPADLRISNLPYRGPPIV